MFQYLELALAMWCWTTAHTVAALVPELTNGTGMESRPQGLAAALLLLAVARACTAASSDDCIFSESL
jgi:hypothetical protein